MEVIKEFFQEKSIVQHNIDSYNIFIEEHVQKIVNESKDIEISKTNEEEKKCKICFGDVYITKPTNTETDGQTTLLEPAEARKRNLTYSCNLFVDLKMILPEKTETLEKCFLGKIPVMVKSKYCNLYNKETDDECIYDNGAYFIISGSEKVLISQEKMNNNEIYVFYKSSSKVLWEAEIRSVSENEIKSTSTLKLLLVRTNDYDVKIKMSVPFLKTEIPIMMMFELLGFKSHEAFFENDDEITEILTSSVNDVDAILEGESIQDYIKKRMTNNQNKKNQIENMLDYYFLPHMKTHKSKAFLLAHMIQKLILAYIGKVQEDDRDHFKNKRIDLPGDLLAGLFRQLYKKTIKEMVITIQKNFDNNRIFNFNSIIKSKVITNGLKYGLSTGNWGLGTMQGIRTGISQVLNRQSTLATLSHLRRINSPIGKEGKLTIPRQLHGSHAYRICPAETPEGQPCGLVKNMALLACTSTGSSSLVINELLEDMDVIKLEDCEKIYEKATKVFVNGRWHGVNFDHVQLITSLKMLKRSCAFDPMISIIYDKIYNTIKIHTDSGRICRPLIIVENGVSKYTESVKRQLLDGKLTFSCLLSYGIIEYVDCDEEETTLIAFDIEDMNKRKLNFTHLEIHPSAMLGICASMIPFPDHNQSPRNVYSAAMTKQSMGTYITNHENRMDTFSHVLWYPQRSLVRTPTMDMFNMDQFAHGINCVVAIGCYGGHNQEDSVIMSQSAIDRGMFRSFFNRTYKDEQKQYGSSCKDKMKKPDATACVGMKYGNYEKLDNDGFVPPGVFVDGDDVIIGKTSTMGKGENEVGYTEKDTSTTIRHNESGIIDKVMITTNDHGAQLVKTKVRSMRVPQVGDKFASRHGQKGTVGITLPQEDMPFTAEGIIPDIIINPHAIPSRMTIAQLIECICGKIACNNGDIKYSTAFDHDTPEKFCEELLNCGYQSQGMETMYSGYTGEQLKAKIFIGPTFYQRLKHMVSDKIHSRRKGPIQILTRQPVEGRSREGGLRLIYQPLWTIKCLQVTSISGDITKLRGSPKILKVIVKVYIKTMEEWKKVHINENYLISNTGFVKGPRGKILKTCLRNGYKSLSISNGTTKSTQNVHTLVAHAFLEKISGKEYVNHIDGNKENNAASNLEWVDSKENTKHAISTGLAKHWLRKVNQYTLDNMFVNSFDSIKEAEKCTGVSNKHISSVCRGKRNNTGGYIWKYVDNIEVEATIPKGIKLPTYPNYVITPDSRVYSIKYSAYLIPKTLPSGYQTVKICNQQEKKDIYIHTLHKLYETYQSQTENEKSPVASGKT